MMKDIANIHWEEMPKADRQAVVEMYNKYYDNVNDPIDLERADACWTGSRWITIKYTFGIKPYNVA